MAEVGVGISKDFKLQFGAHRRSDKRSPNPDTRNQLRSDLLRWRISWERSLYDDSLACFWLVSLQGLILERDVERYVC
jgi:hypothetical protein